MRSIFTLFLLLTISNSLLSQTNYTFIGKGLWTLQSNWYNNNIPPATLPSGSTIYIYPTFRDTCILNVDQTIDLGATLQVEQAIFKIANGAVLNAKGNVNVKEIKIDSVQICNQKWMTKNLDVAKYRNGDTIPQVTDSATWANLTTGAWCYYNNDPAYGTKFGKLYNWYAVNDPRGLAPVGWHIPTSTEWATFTTCLGGNTVAGGAIKQPGVFTWKSPNIGATNSSGFTALAGNYLYDRFSSVGIFAQFWSATALDAIQAYGRIARNDQTTFHLSVLDKIGGLSVRCIKD